jgi:hypothetical protein
MSQLSAKVDVFQVTSQAVLEELIFLVHSELGTRLAREKLLGPP